MRQTMFFGAKVSDYGLAHNRLDYGALGRAINHVYVDPVLLQEISDFEPVCGALEYDDEPVEVFQFFVIDSAGANLLQRCFPTEVVWYSYKLDMYVWGVTHCGTCWDYVLTDYVLDPDME